MTRVVALYCRLSPRPDGSYEGVDAQERWGRTYAEQHWPGAAVEVFADAGISAAKDGLRPEYERLRQWVTDGQVAQVWCVEQSRLERREIGWFELAAILDAAGIHEVHTNRDGIVRVRDDVAGIKAVLNAGEVRKMTKRVLDSIAEKARNGEPSGARPYGYVRAKTSEGVKTYAVVPEQADVIRECAERVLSGWSLGAIARDLDERGLRAPHGGPMIGEAVRRILVSAAVAGKRRHGDRIYPGNWPAILGEDTWQSVCARLSAPRTVRRSDGGTFEITDGYARRGGRVTRKYLLTALAVCGVCGAPLYGSLKQGSVRGGERRPSAAYYLCHKSRGGKGCVGIRLEPTEDYVRDELFAQLDKPEFLDAIAADEHGARRDEITSALQAVERQRDELAGLWATPGELTMSEWQTARRALAEHEQQLRRELAEVPPPLVNVDIATARGAWPDMTLDERREFLRLFIAKVTVKRATPGTKGFDPGRVEIELRRR